MLFDDIDDKSVLNELISDGYVYPPVNRELKITPKGLRAIEEAKKENAKSVFSMLLKILFALASFIAACVSIAEY